MSKLNVSIAMRVSGVDEPFSHEADLRYTIPKNKLAEVQSAISQALLSLDTTKDAK